MRHQYRQAYRPIFQGGSGLSRPHRRTGEGAATPSPRSRVKPLFFQAKAEVFGQKPTGRNEKNVFIKRKERNSFRSAR